MARAFGGFIMKRSPESGATMVEYTILCLLIAVVLYNAFNYVYEKTSCQFHKAGSAVASETAEDC